MDLCSLVSFADVKDAPTVRKVLPSPLRIGDVLNFKFILRRFRGRRTEELLVDGDFRVTSVTFDARGASPRQVLTVEATRVSPTWKSVKTTPFTRRFGPSRAPRTPVI